MNQPRKRYGPKPRPKQSFISRALASIKNEITGGACACCGRQILLSEPCALWLDEPAHVLCSTCFWRKAPN